MERTHPKKEIKAQSIKKNYTYNLIYQVLLIIVPLIVTPYVSQVLLPEGVGQYSYAYSIITYFSLFAALGFGYYAQREITKERDNAYKRSLLFWEIFLCRLIPTIICLALNIILSLIKIYGDDSFLMLIMSSNIVAVAFEATYYFQGMEDFKKVVFRNVLVKIITVIFIFVFVNSPDDVWIYALINLGMVLIGNLTLWIGLPDYLVRVKFSDLHPLRHMPGTLRLFIPTIVITLYPMLDKTLIGIITQSDAQNGYYEQADKVVKLTITVISCLGTVMIPRNTSEFKRGNVEKLKYNIYFASKFVWFLGTALAFGLAATTFNFNGWFFGAGYEPVNSIICVLSALSVIIGLSNVIGTQYLIPVGRDKIFTLTVTAGAAINVALNIPLIIFFGAFGAAIATIIAECSVTAMQLICVRKELCVQKIIFGGIKNIIAGGIMFAAILPMSLNMPGNAGYTVLIVCAGAAIYFLSLFILRDKFFIENVGKVCKRLLRKCGNGTGSEVESSSADQTYGLTTEPGTIATKRCGTFEKEIHIRAVKDGLCSYKGKFSEKKYMGRYAPVKYKGKYAVGNGRK